jgi:hypothetical protein
MRLTAGTLGVMLAVIAWSAPAAALEITFDDLVSAGNPMLAAVETSGFRVAGPALHTIDTPGSLYVDGGSAVYLAQTDGAAGEGLTLRRLDGAEFDVYDFAAGRLFTSATGGPSAAQISLLGLGVGGATLSATYELAAAGFASFGVPSTWSHLEAVVFQGVLPGGGAGAFALDDVGVGSGPATGPVPEPAAIVLALTTALAVGAVLLRGRL